MEGNRANAHAPTQPSNKSLLALITSRIFSPATLLPLFQGRWVAALKWVPTLKINQTVLETEA